MWYQWLIFGLLIIIMPLGIINLLKLCSKKVPLTEEQKRHLNVTIVKLTLFYWICDLFYMSFIIDNIVCRYIFGGLVLLIIFCNLWRAFSRQGDKTINPIRNFGLIQDFVVGIGLSVYLIYIISDNDLRTVVTAIVSALYGGLLTLAGVSWTIKNENRNRQSEIERIEKEKQREKDLLATPIICISDKKSAGDWVKVFTDNVHGRTNEISAILRNTDKCVFYIDEVEINGFVFKSQLPYLIQKDEIFKLLVRFGEDVKIDSFEKINLHIKDMNFKDRVFEIHYNENRFPVYVAEARDE